MNITKMNEFIKQLYDVSDVEMGFNYWYFKLLNFVLNIFEYQNLPEGLNKRELEINLVLTGHAAVIRLDDGSLFTPNTCTFGYDANYQPDRCVFANPVIISTKEYMIGKDCEVIYNNILKDSIYYVKADSGLNTFICRYARQLSDIESTINIYTVNQRMTSFPVANDGAVKESLRAFFKNLILGKRAIVTDSTIIENFRNVDINRSAVKDGINDWLIARDKVLEQFFRDIGVKMHINKKAQMNEEEVTSDNQLLLISTDDMLAARKEGVDKVNKMFNTNITVSINPLFQVERSDSNVDTE